MRANNISPCGPTLFLHIMVFHMAIFCPLLVPLEHPHWCSVCDPAKAFQASKFVFLIQKTETGAANMWELLIANHLDQSLWLANPKQGSASQIISITLFCSRCTLLLRFVTSPCLLRDGHSKAWAQGCSQTLGERMSTGTSPYVNNSLFYFLHSFSFPKKEIFPLKRENI
jgi:hypothetical protein